MNVTVHLQNDGHLAAIVRVPSIQDAQYCVSQLHRRKLGSKRIMIAYDQNSHGLGSGRSVPTPLQIRYVVGIRQTFLCKLLYRPFFHEYFSAELK
jgi:meiosis arrest female protein 1